jgi:hypothetical protein
MVRRRQQYTPAPRHPLYGWALDAAGQPVHILEAGHSEAYYCPVCGGKMIARLGDIKQHHFAHETLQFCEPEEVARAAASRWLAHHIQACLNEKRGIVVAWSCPLCHQPHTADLLDGISEVRQKHEHDGLLSDLALMDAENRVRVALLLHKPASEALITYARLGITVIAVDATQGRFSDLPTLLAGSHIYGGICTTQKSAAQNGVVTEPADLRQVFTEAVAGPPHYVYGPLGDFAGLTHVFTLGDKKLWLPPILWQRAIGGLLHTINPALQIITQEWPQPDGSVIALYYVTARDTNAITVRRFPPGQPVYARLDSAAFRSDRLTAVRIARSFAEL